MWAPVGTAGALQKAVGAKLVGHLEIINFCIAYLMIDSHTYD